MRRFARSVMAIVAPAAMVAAMVGGAFGAPAAQAYGTNHVYQLTFSTGNYIVFDPNSDIGFIAFPVTPGHYSNRFGPGIQTQGTVVKMH